MLTKEKIKELQKEAEGISIELKGFKIESYSDLERYGKLSDYYVSLLDRIAFCK